MKNKRLSKLVRLPRLVASLPEIVQRLEETERDLREARQALKHTREYLNLEPEKGAIPFAYEMDVAPFKEHAESRVGAPTGEETFYSHFTEISGGANEPILKLQYASYLKYLPKGAGTKFLDIGCGAGEFLSFLKENGIGALGIDTNAVEVERAAQRGLEVQRAEASAFLKAYGGRLSGISLLQVVEHIPPEGLAALLELAIDKLESGGVLLIETINLRSVTAFDLFYTDPTHTRPVQSTYLSFLLQWLGLRRLKLVYTLPSPGPGQDSRDVHRTYLNYALIGEKP